MLDSSTAHVYLLAISTSTAGFSTNLRQHIQRSSHKLDSTLFHRLVKVNCLKLQAETSHYHQHSILYSFHSDFIHQSDHV